MDLDFLAGTMEEYVSIVLDVTGDITGDLMDGDWYTELVFIPKY